MKEVEDGDAEDGDGKGGIRRRLSVPGRDAA